MPSGHKFSLPSVHEISQMNTKFLLQDLFKQPDVDSLFNKHSLRLHLSRFLFFKCAVANCSNTDIEIHHIKNSVDGLIAMVKSVFLRQIINVFMV